MGGRVRTITLKPAYLSEDTVSKAKTAEICYPLKLKGEYFLDKEMNVTGRYVQQHDRPMERKNMERNRLKINPNHKGNSTCHPTEGKMLRKYQYVCAFTGKSNW